MPSSPGAFSISKTFAFDEAKSAFDYAQEKGVLKVVLKF